MSEPTDAYSHVPDGAATADGRAIAFAVLALADEVRALREMLESPSVPVEPGDCWHDSGVPLPNGADFTYRCELKAGHLGAHESRRGNGTAVWPAEATR